MVISWFSSDAYPKLGVYQIVANQSRQVDIWRSLNEGGHRSLFPAIPPTGKISALSRW
jgi:hypothetical protein